MIGLVAVGARHLDDPVDAPPRARPKRHARGDAAARARARLGEALVGMAFLAVLREGLETAVFMLAAFDASTTPTAAGIGAVLGVVVAVAIGWGIYRGGVRINLARFFRSPASSSCSSPPASSRRALHTAHEAGWINSLRPGARPHVARRPGHRPRGAAHRDVRPAAAADGQRGGRVAALRDPDARRRALARASGSAPSRAGHAGDPA